jgi:hypothetical protein
MNFGMCEVTRVLCTKIETMYLVWTLLSYFSIKLGNFLFSNVMIVSMVPLCWFQHYIYLDYLRRPTRVVYGLFVFVN